MFVWRAGYGIIGGLCIVCSVPGQNRLTDVFHTSNHANAVCSRRQARILRTLPRSKGLSLLRIEGPFIHRKQPSI